MENFITKKSFNALSVKDQVDLFNKFIREDKINIGECCKKVGISYSTIRDRFKKNNYIFNKFTKQYENVDEIFPYEDKLINKIVDEMNKKNQIIEILRLNPHSKCNIVNRSFGIDKDTLNRFISFCDNSKYKQYDILTKFIEEGLNKYDKNIV